MDTSTKYELYQIVHDAMVNTFPAAIAAGIEVSKKLDGLADHVTPAVAARSLGLSRSTISNYIKTGMLRPIYFEGLSRGKIPKEQLKELFIKESLKDHLQKTSNGDNEHKGNHHL